MILIGDSRTTCVRLYDRNLDNCVEVPSPASAMHLALFEGWDADREPIRKPSNSAAWKALRRRAYRAQADRDRAKEGL